MENKLEEFIIFLKDHLIFALEALEYRDFESSENISPEEFEKLPRYYEKALKCGKNFTELDKIKNESIIYLHEIFSHYKFSYSVLTSSSIALLKNHLSGYYTNIIEGKPYSWHKEIDFQKGDTFEDYGQYISQEYTHVEYEKISNHFKQQISAIEIVIEQNDNLEALAGGATQIKKIKTSMSVPELALFFRLLYEVSKIKRENNKMDICRMISASFKTEATENISVDSLMNNWNSPDSRSIEKIRELMPKLRQAYLDLDK